MFITRNKSIRIVAPLALAGALLLTGCSSTATAPEKPAASAAPSADASSTDQTDGDVELVDSTIDKLDAAPDDAKAVLTELSIALDAVPGLDGVGISYWNPEVDINLVVPNALEENLTGDQLRQVLEILGDREYPATVEGFIINVWGSDQFAGDSSTPAAEIGLKDEFIDSGWGWVKFTVADLGALYK